MLTEPRERAALEPSDAPVEHDHQAVDRLRRQTRRADRLSRRVRAAWQEKLLALRMQTLFGRRFVAILENTVLVLILVLFSLITAQVVLERTSSSGLSIWQHQFFAWTDLGICSVFLFEFVLKLARSQQIDLLGAPLLDRPGRFAAVWLCLSSDCPGTTGERLPRRGRPTRALAAIDPFRARLPFGSSEWPCRFSD